MFAVAAILMFLGAWSLITCLLDWDATLGMLDIQVLGELLGHETARWTVGAAGGALLLVGILAAR
jgi:hypothetical protein